MRLMWLAERPHDLKLTVPYPSILIEMGNMKNAADAAVLESAGGRSQLADAVVSGITAYLTQAPRSR